MTVPVKVRLMSNVEGKAFSSTKTIKPHAGNDKNDGSLVFHFKKKDEPKDANKAVVGIETWWKDASGKERHGGISGNWTKNTNWVIDEDGNISEL